MPDFPYHRFIPEFSVPCDDSGFTVLCSPNFSVLCMRPSTNELVISREKETTGQECSKGYIGKRASDGQKLTEYPSKSLHL